MPIDHEAIGKKTYLRLEEAAAYVGYDHTYSNPIKAFTASVNRHRARLPRLYWGGRVMFRRRDLDLFLEGKAKERPIKTVQGES